MFGSVILDVGVGVMLAFLGVSLAASALTEALNSWRQTRQATLIKGVQALLNDPAFCGLARDLFNHALVNPLSDGTARDVAHLTAKPAYIRSSDFAAALVDIIKSSPSMLFDPSQDAAMAPMFAPVAPPKPEKTLNEAVNEIEDLQIRQTLRALLTSAGGEEVAFQLAVGRWFDSGMERVSGAYKRNAQLSTVCIALLVAMVLNIDGLHITTVLWQRPVLAQGLPAGTEVAAPATDYLLRLEQSTLIGWQGFGGSDRDPRAPGGNIAGFLGMILGWLIVAGASLFGAPFWFDTLQRITQLRGEGGGEGIQNKQTVAPEIPARAAVTTIISSENDNLA
jgi:hypothetical protein